MVGYEMAVGNIRNRVTVFSKITNRMKLFYCFLFIIIRTSKADEHDDGISGKELRVVIAHVSIIQEILPILRH